MSYNNYNNNNNRNNNNGYNNSNNYNNNNSNNNSNVKRSFNFDVFNHQTGKQFNCSGTATPTNGKIKVTLTIANVFVIRGVYIRYTKDNRPFLSFPSFKTSKGDFVDWVYMLDTDCRNYITDNILKVC